MSNVYSDTYTKPYLNTSGSTLRYDLKWNNRIGAHKLGF